MRHLPDHFIFMKVGAHAGESFERIMTRKKKELDSAGMIFWGYGGNTCHPLRHVHPFVQAHHKSGSLYLVMQSIDSKAVPEIVPATEYSVDGVDWMPLPKGVSGLGSRYALILGDITPGELDFPTGQFVVASGNSEGRNANEYLRGHIDKGCFLRSSDPGAEEGRVKKISHIAKVQDPYSVFLRGPVKR